MVYPFVILVNALNLRKSTLSLPSAELIGVLCGIELFVTPWVYAFILFFGFFFLSGPHPQRQKVAFMG